MVIHKKLNERNINVSIIGIFLILYLTIFYASSGEKFVKEFPLLSIIRSILTLILVFALINNKDAIRKAFKYQSKILIFIIFFLVYQIFQIFINNSPITGFIKYIFYFSTIVLLVFSDISKSFSKIQRINNYIVFLFCIIFGFHVFYMLSHPFSAVFRETRIEILQWNNNENAGFFATTIPFILFMLNYRKKLLLGFLMLFYFIFIFYNGSIAGIIGSIISVFFYFFLNSKMRFTKIRYFFVLVVFMFSFINQITKFDSIFSGGLYDAFTGNSQEGNLSGRIGGIWLPVINYVSKHSLLFGFGGNSYENISEKAGTFTLQGISYNVVYVFRDAHNFFLVSFVEGGLINFFTILFFFIMGIRSCLFTINYSKIYLERRYAVTVLCSWIGLITWCMMYNAWYSGGWYFFVLLFSLSLIIHNNVVKSKEKINYEDRNIK
jgi:hypothetical protein